MHAQGYQYGYAYEPNSTSDRVNTLTAPFLKQTVYSHESGRDALISVSNRVGFQIGSCMTPDTGGVIVSQRDGDSGDEDYAYAYDKIGN